MLNWDDMRHFMAMAEAGSLSGAARRLQVEHATVARRIAALEQRIGARLIIRRGRRYGLTPAGEQVAAHARRMEEEALAVERVGLGADADRVTEITMTAPPTMASELIVPRLPAFKTQYPELRLRIVGASQNLSLTRREADVALRLSRPDIASLIARKAGTLAYGLYASSHYRTATAEADYQFITLEDDLATAPQQLWLDGLRGPRPVSFRSSDLTLQCAAARAHMGVAALPVFLGEAQGLSRLDPEKGLRRDVWLGFHRDLRGSPAISAVSRFLLDCLPA